MQSSEEIPVRTARLVRQHVLDEVDDVIRAITFDGRRLVLAAGYRLFRIRPDSGRVVDQLETFPDPGGLAYDGRHLWQRSEGRIQQLDPRTGLVLKALALPLDEITGLECTDGDLLLLHTGGRRLARVETHRGAVVGDVDVNPSLRGLAWVGPELWSSTGEELCCVDPSSGRVVVQFALPAGLEARDLAVDGEGLVWCVDGASRAVRALAKSVDGPALERSNPLA